MLYVGRVFVFHEKLFYVVLEDSGLPLDYVMQVGQDDIPGLRLPDRSQGLQRMCHFLAQPLRQILTIQVPEAAEDDLDCGECDGRVDVADPRQNILDDGFGLLLVGGFVACDRVQDEDESPFHSLIKNKQQFLELLEVQFKKGDCPHLGDLLNSLHEVGKHERVALSLEEGDQCINEVLILARLGYLNNW